MQWRQSRCTHIGPIALPSSFAMATSSGLSHWGLPGPPSFCDILIILALGCMLRKASALIVR